MYYYGLKEKIVDLKESAKEDKMFFKNVVKKIDELQNFADEHKIGKNDITNLAFITKLLQKTLKTRIKHDKHDIRIGEDFRGYTPKINHQLAMELSNGKFVKKTITTNVIYESEDKEFDDGYSYSSETVYYPLKIQIYCPNDFDTKKIYTIKEVEQLAKNKQIIHFKESVIDFDLVSKELPNKTNKYKICGINYDKNYELRFISSILDIGSDIKFKNHFGWLNNDNFSMSNIVKSMENYPDLAQSLTNAIVNTLKQDKICFTNKIKSFKTEFIKDYLKILDERQEHINELQKELNKEKENLKKLEQNSTKIEELIM